MAAVAAHSPSFPLNFRHAPAVHFDNVAYTSEYSEPYRFLDARAYLHATSCTRGPFHRIHVQRSKSDRTFRCARFTRVRLQYHVTVCVAVSMASFPRLGVGTFFGHFIISFIMLLLNFLSFKFNLKMCPSNLSIFFEN